jgi:hypothetical protein
MGAPSLETARQERRQKVDRLKTAVLGAALVMLASSASAGWTTVKNEPDPFEPSKSTFIAATVDDHGGLVWPRHPLLGGRPFPSRHK